jgi:N-acetylglucosaminyl-diphospho-decaprenol L-rhamnosyltransferase
VREEAQRQVSELPEFAAKRIPEISFCVVNTNGREALLRCLGSVFEHAPSRGFEVLVLDNASDDGSAAAVKESFGDRVALIELEERRGKPENDSELIARAAGRWCLLLNEDSELTAGAADALVEALEDGRRAAAAGARLLDSAGAPQPSAWRFPGLRTALAGVVFLHRRFTVQSRGEKTRPVDWVQSAGMLVRKDAFDEIGPLDPAFFVYSDEVDWQRRAHDAGWSILYVPAAAIVHGEQLSQSPGASRRIIEFSRNRDRYLRKHRGPVIAAIVRVLTSFTYLVRALAAVARPGHSPRRYLAHAYHSFLPGRGEGLREAADAYNATLRSRRKEGRP